MGTECLPLAAEGSTVTAQQRNESAARFLPPVFQGEQLGQRALGEGLASAAQEGLGVCSQESVCSLRGMESPLTHSHQLQRDFRLHSTSMREWLPPAKIGARLLGKRWGVKAPLLPMNVDCYQNQR